MKFNVFIRDVFTDMIEEGTFMEAELVARIRYGTGTEVTIVAVPEES